MTHGDYNIRITAERISDRKIDASDNPDFQKTKKLHNLHCSMSEKYEIQEKGLKLSYSHKFLDFDDDGYVEQYECARVRRVGRGGNEWPRVPTQRQPAVVLLHSVPIAAGEQGQQHTSLLVGVRAQVNRGESGRFEPGSPLSQRLVALDPVHALAGHHVADLPPQIHLRHDLILVADGAAFAGGAALERVEEGGVVV
nr:hypothetical protein KK1_023643 [Ipomoea batatas]